MDHAFVHLRLHSEYSLSDGIVRIPRLIDACTEQTMPAVAVTDRNNVFALIKLYQTCEGAGVKPLVASDLLVASDNANEEPTPLVLIARTDEGYANLCNLLSRAYSEGQSMGVASAQPDWIEERAAGLIALSAGPEGDVGRALLAGNADLARERAQQWQRIFPDGFYLELHRTGRAREEEYNAGAVNLAVDIDCPVVATNDVRFLRKEEFDAHEARVCIHDSTTLDDPRRERRYSAEQYLKSAEQMCALFEDIPEAIENTVEIARRCNVSLELGEPWLPDYPIPEGETAESLLESLSRQGLATRLKKKAEAGNLTIETSDYDERLAYELGVINSMGFPGYFLIVMEFIQWAKDNQIPVGPGRGSGAGSLVAWALQITDIDPLEYDLLFERFLNPERVSMPDFDIDFCEIGRDKVIDHVAEKYGRDAVFRIVTFGSMAAKAVVRDVARVQGKPHGLADKLAKLIPPDPGIKLEEALGQEPAFKAMVQTDDEAGEILEMALQLEGLVRNIGQHAAGVVIEPAHRAGMVPTCKGGTGSDLLTQFDMKDVEMAGLVKFDFLGLKTLTVIDQAVSNINAKLADKGEPLIDMTALDLTDPAIYADLHQAKTTAVFQLESSGMKDLMKKVKPSRFADIVALVALFRPGPMDLADDFIARKHGRQEVDYLHPSLEPVLEDTYGILLYQEQVMQISQILAGYSLAEADLLRRAMGKKIASEMAKQRPEFLAGAKENGVDERQANNIFDLMEKFAQYGFNKPHSVAYSMIAYQTAWLKHYYPADYMASVLSTEMDSTDKLVVKIDECREMGLDVLPPDVNQGEHRFVASGSKEIVYGLGAIKGLGEGHVSSIVEARQTGGRFTDLFDFCERVDPRKVNRRALDALAGSGAFDSLVDVAPESLPQKPADDLGYKRALLAANLEDATRLAEQKAWNKESGTTDLFGTEGLVDESSDNRYNYQDSLRCPSFKERLVLEKNCLGLYLTGHLIDDYRAELERFNYTKLASLKPSRSEQIVAGLIVNLRQMRTKRGDQLNFVVLDDKTGRMEVTVSGNLMDENRDKLKKDEVVLIKGVVSDDDYTQGVRMRANKVQTITEARAGRLERLGLDFSFQTVGDDFVKELAGILSPFLARTGRDACRVAVRCGNEPGVGDVILGEEWRVSPADELIQSLRDRYGSDRVRLDYR